MDRSDDEIGEGILRRRSGAFDMFYERYSAPLLGYLVGLLGQRALAEDLVQETMLRVYRGIDRYQERGNFRAWVYRIATNLALTELRRRRSFPTEALGESVRDVADPNVPGPMDGLEREERRGIVEAGIASLPEEQRVVMLLRVRQGLPLSEIARTLCVPEGTVKSRLHHGVMKLRRFVERCGAAREGGGNENV